ncbi:SGNH/GDSL hydrolase family protein [Paenibacillus koleovorans]|uniref:SGNH/GDSL hydrolase family protein n=1 Tax=Paenibacillus koleovorans TaxID=121608 RepID=UPI001FE9A94B|nr:SGNH/GDSL hydrolase family protein [Paenibacillus koleovorans]
MKALLSMQTIQMESSWFRGAISLERWDKGIQPWRLPYDQFNLFDPGLMQRAAIPSGVRIAIETDSTRLGLKVQAAAQERQFDLVLGQDIHSSLTLSAGDELLTVELPDGLKQAEIYLPHKVPVTLQALLVDDGAIVSPMAERQPRWVTYGSSITQCSAAASPALTWPAIVARRMGWDLTSLGFGGQCHLEPMVARLIRDLPAEFISLCLGINVYNRGSLNLRTFRSAVIGMICIIREKHPNTPLFSLSPIYSPVRETTDNSAGLCLVKIREEIREAVAILTAAGDRNLHYLDGLDILGSQHAGYLPDQLHPNAEGYQIMAENLLQTATFTALKKEG